jgi:intracellular proteinase inhibitor BsuPI
MVRVLPLLIMFSVSSGLRADPVDYFPLHVGNSWLYRMIEGRLAGDDRYRSISVDGTESAGDRDYFNVNYFGRPLLLRQDADGSIVMFDKLSGTEKPWLSLAQPEGSTFATALDQCSSIGRIVSRGAGLSAPIGEIADAVQVGFRGNCADAGITQQFYAAGVGLVSHEETSFAGPRRWELVYYRAGIRNETGRELSFTVALDSARYAPGSTMGVRLTLRSTHPDPLTLTYPSGQTYDLKILDENGNSVYTWSAGRAFIMIFRQEKFGPGERSYGVTVPLGELPPGRYRVQAYLTTNPQMFTGEAAFEIAP